MYRVFVEKWERGKLVDAVLHLNCSVARRIEIARDVQQRNATAPAGVHYHVITELMATFETDRARRVQLRQVARLRAEQREPGQGAWEWQQFHLEQECEIEAAMQRLIRPLVERKTTSGQ